MTGWSAGHRLLTQFLSQAIHFEQVPEPCPTWQVIAGLRSACGSFFVSKVTVGPAGWAVRAVCVLVVPHGRMLAVVEGDAVVGAYVDRLYSLVVDSVQHLSGGAPGASVCLVRQEGGYQGVDCLGTGVGDLVGSHPLEIHEQELTQDDIRGCRAFCGVHGVGPRRHSTSDGLGDVVSEWDVIWRCVVSDKGFA